MLHLYYSISVAPVLFNQCCICTIQPMLVKFPEYAYIYMIKKIRHEFLDLLSNFPFLRHFFCFSYLVDHKQVFLYWNFNLFDNLLSNLTWFFVSAVFYLVYLPPPTKYVIKSFPFSYYEKNSHFLLCMSSVISTNPHTNMNKVISFSSYKKYTFHFFV